jgi:DNA-binding IclR family transcriptional regulator
MRQKDSKSNAIEKALEILMAFVPYNQELGTIEISRKLDLHKATVSRILLNLTRSGFLQQNLKTKKYMLGEKALLLGNAVSQSLRSNIVPLAKPYIDDLRETLKETAVLEVFSGFHTVMAYVADGPQPVRVAAPVGESLPQHAAAGTKAILAFSPSEVRDRCINGHLPALTPNTITSRDDYQRHLIEVRRQGHALDMGEIDLGMHAAAVPVFNHEEKPVAAVVVVGLSSRIPGENGRVVAKITETAARISDQLHYHGDFFTQYLGSV